MSGATVNRMITINETAPSPITELWRVLSRHKLLFVLVAACVVIIGSAIVARLPKTYSATTTVMVPPQEADPLQASQAGMSAQDDDARTVTEAAMLTSRDVASAVVESLGLGLAPSRPSRASQLACDYLGFECGRNAAVPTLDQRIDSFLAQLTVVQEPHSRVLDVTVVDRDPTLAARAANAVVMAEQSLALSRASDDMDHTAAWLDRRTSELRERWLGAVQAANAYRVLHQITAAEAATGGTGQGLSVTEVQQGSSNLLEAQARLAAAEAQEGALQSARHGGNAAAAADPEVTALAGQLATIEAARAQAAGQLGPRHPELRALDGQVASARSSLDAAVGRALGAVMDRAISARAEVAQLEGGLRTLKGSAGQEAGPVAQYGTLEQEAASARTVYETFLTRQKELTDRTAILQPSVAFVSHAPVPDQPSAPKRSRLLAGVVALALALASTVVFLREHLAAGFSDVARLRTGIRLPLISVVPRVPGRRDTVRRHVLEQPYGRASEAMRSVMAQITLAAGHDEKTQTVLISSADAGEGKTTIALWLATLAAKGGPGVLLIDGDHRRGLVSAQFGNAGQAPGLVELLAGETSLDQVLQTDVATGVRFIAAGKSSARPLGQTEIRRLEGLLTTLRSEFWLIVIDSPPLIGMSDALVYARLASQTVFVCRWRDTSRLAATTAVERLRESGARLSGMVLSMVDPRASISYGADYGPRDVRGIRRLYGQ